jgi:hypothetical protein
MTITTPPRKAPPWDPEPQRGEHGSLLAVRSGATELARYVDGAGSREWEAPRPHLHPLRTPSGVVVTDASPLDHPWHLGLGIGVQDVAGHNLWGGRTYLRDGGYRWRRDHGRIVHEGWARRVPGAVEQQLRWLGADGTTLLREDRALSWTVLGDDAWRLDLTWTLTLPAGAAEPVALGSPGTHGREAAGYGGLFWRLPACHEVDVRTPAGRGEEGVHGTRPADGAPWLAWSATASPGGTAQQSAPPHSDPAHGDAAHGDPTHGGTGTSAEPGRVRALGTPRGPRDFTVIAVPTDAVTAQDPWFVRVEGYPGFGSALAWADPVTVRHGAPLRRAFSFVVADGRWDDARVAEQAELVRTLPPHAQEAAR